MLQYWNVNGEDFLDKEEILGGIVDFYRDNHAKVIRAIENRFHPSYIEEHPELVGAVFNTYYGYLSDSRSEYELVNLVKELRQKISEQDEKINQLQEFLSSQNHTESI